MKFKRFLLGLSVFIMALAVACGSSEGSVTKDEAPSPTVAMQGEKILELGMGSPSTLDPQQCNDVGCAMYVDEIYSGLLTLTLVPKEKLSEYSEQRNVPVLKEGVVEKLPGLWQEWANTYMKKSDSMAVVLAPDIAKEVPEPVLNDDGTVSYTFHLRDNVFFHNGKHMTAHDFKFSFERAASPNWPDRWSAFTLPTADLYLSDIVGVRDRMFKKAGVSEVTGVEVVEDYILKITIDAPKSYFLWKLTYPTAFVIDKDKLVDPSTGEARNQNWTDPPNGTGPFSMVPGTDQSLLLANKEFYLGAPYLDKVVINHQGGQNPIFAYDAGDVDMAGLGVDYLPRINPASPKYDEARASQYISTTSFDVFYVAFNTEKAPFDDLNVRRAFAMAINKSDLAIIGEGLYTPANGIVPPGIAGYDPEFEGIKYDPEKAKELLRASKYWGTDTLKNVELLKGGSGPDVGPVTELVLDAWRNIGIDVVLDEPATGGVYQSRVSGGDYQISMSGWIADYPDAEDFLDLKLYCNMTQDPVTGKQRCERDYANNQARYHNVEFDMLLEKARVEQDPEARTALYKKAQEIAVNDAPWIPMVHTKNSIVVKPHVKGYYPAPMMVPMFRFIDIR